MPSYNRSVRIPGKSAQELYDKVAQDIDRFMEKAGIGKVDIDRDPAKRQIGFKSSMFTGTLACAEGAINLDAKLSFLAAPFKSKIDEGIDRWLSKTFNLTA